MALQRAVYRPRDAEHTVLHQVIALHLEAFLEAVAEAGNGAGLPHLVEREFRVLAILLWHRLLGWPASESGRLCRGDRGHGRGHRRRRALMLAILRWRTNCRHDAMRGKAMREAVENLVTLFEQGTLSREQLIEGLLAAVAPPDVAANAEFGPTLGNPTFRGRSLNHVTLSVTDVERSKVFYSRMLGGAISWET